MEDWLIWFLAAIVLVVAEMLSTPGFGSPAWPWGAWQRDCRPGTGSPESRCKHCVRRRQRGEHDQSAAGCCGASSSARAPRADRCGSLRGSGVVLERIDPSAPGRVKVEGEDWRGASVDDTPIERAQDHGDSGRRHHRWWKGRVSDGSRPRAGGAVALLVVVPSPRHPHRAAAQTMIVERFGKYHKT